MAACPYKLPTHKSPQNAITNNKTKDSKAGKPKNVIIETVIKFIGITKLKLLPIVLKPYKITKLKNNFLIKLHIFFIVSPNKKYELLIFLFYIFTIH